MAVFDRAHEIAACLGLEEATLRRLQARGYLRTLDLSEAEIRERLYRGHSSYLLALMPKRLRSARVGYAVPKAELT
jgi:hypothetical protein